MQFVILSKEFDQFFYIFIHYQDATDFLINLACLFIDMFVFTPIIQVYAEFESSDSLIYILNYLHNFKMSKSVVLCRKIAQCSCE